ncbi:MAG: type II toxin-antitoxin system VapC family toxin [Candidatus Scalindua sp.]
MKKKVYIETSVISYYNSRLSRDIITASHQQITQEWWDKQLHLYKSFISEVVFEEISKGDPIVAQKRIGSVKGFPFLEITPEIINLSREYYKALILPDKARLDAVHLALAVYHGMDFLLIWNFLHIVGAKPRAIIEQINYKNGIKTPILCTPEELME